MDTVFKKIWFNFETTDWTTDWTILKEQQTRKENITAEQRCEQRGELDHGFSDYLSELQFRKSGSQV